jgi:hypothetical protein
VPIPRLPRTSTAVPGLAGGHTGGTKISLPANSPPAPDLQELAKHFSATYFALRLGLAILGFAFPFALFFYGRWRHGLDLQPSMSAYFWAAGAADQCATFPMRTIFVGFLFAIGVGLYAYKGFTPLENVLLNIAGVCATAVAVFPERIVPREAQTDLRIDRLFQSCPAVKAWAAQDPMPIPIHYIAAVILFVLLAVVAWTCADKTLQFAPPAVNVDRFRRLYKFLAFLMIVFPLPGLAAATVLGLWDRKIFSVEAAGIMTFGAYWALKSQELRLSQLETQPAIAIEHARHRQERAGMAPHRSEVADTTRRQP